MQSVGLKEAVEGFRYQFKQGRGRLIRNAIVVQSLSCVQLFATPRTAACQAPLFSTISQSLLRFMSIELVILSNLCCLLLLPSIFPASGSFPVSQLFASGGQRIGVSASASVLPMSIQGWLPLGWTGWISFQSKGLSRVFGVLKNVFWCVISPKSS